jgi:cobalt/nickel transport system ATP-binding protein
MDGVRSGGGRLSLSAWGVPVILFKLENVSYAYAGRFPALCEVSLSIGAGEKVALLGPNGSGKSTVLRMMDGLLFPDSGSVCYMGSELTEEYLRGEANRAFRSKVGLLFQNPEIQLFSPTVWEDVMFGPAQLGLEKSEAKKRVEESLAQLNIEGLKDRAPHELSIGEKKRVAIAGILALNPDVLLLDEPTAGLDPRSCRALIDIILAAGDSGKTIITATHDLHLVDEIADRAYVFGEDKRAIAEGKTADILGDEDRLREWNLLHIHRHRHGEVWHDHEHRHKHDHGHGNS